MFQAVEDALKRFEYDDVHKHVSGRIRILLTRVTWWPPFVTGEVADHFPDNETGLKLFRASCHIPILSGLLPMHIRDGYYYDGLMWPSRLLVPWRCEENDHLVSVSAVG